MKPNAPLEDCLEALGSALRRRPRLTERVMAEVRKSAADGSTEGRSTLAPRAAIGRRWQLFAAAVATIAVALLLAVALSPSPSVGWEDVAETIRSQKWIRGTVTLADGRRGTIWLSPERQIWARTSDGSFSFSDGRERAKYQYHRGGITKVPLGEEDAGRILPVDALSQDKSTIGPWLFGAEKIVNQRRREITEAGKTWIEFQMVFGRRGANRATLRVDPETRLPVYLLVTSPEDATVPIKWQFDYPADGPTDIYALGVPREIKIDDRMPSKEALRVLDGITAGRARLGDFRLTVADQTAEQEDNGRSSIVWRKGDRWRVDRCLGSDLPKPADGQDLGDWFAERLKRSEQIPLYICDGKTVYRNPPRGRSDGKAIHWKTGRDPAPQDLMSIRGVDSDLTSAPYVKLVPLVYPGLTPRSGDTFEFDPQPADFPGCVLIKLSMLLTDGSVAHHWCYIDPTKGHAVVRAAVFTLPPDTPASPEASSDCHGVRMEGFQRSPRGFWYPTVVHNTLEGVKTTVRYQFDFDADLPDSLFTVDDAQVP